MTEKSTRSLLRALSVACLIGGILWALSPLGVHLSEVKFKSPNFFWKLFPSAPLMLAVGLIGLHSWQRNRTGWTERFAFLFTLFGLLLVIAGDVMLFWLKLDEVYLTAAPGYRTFRVGLFALAAGAILFGLASAPARALPLWGTLPLTIGAWAGLIAFSENLGASGRRSGYSSAWAGRGWASRPSGRWRRACGAERTGRKGAEGQPLLPAENLYNPPLMDSRGQDRTGGLPGREPEQDIAPGVTPTGRDDTYVARVARGAGISTLGQGVGRLLVLQL